MRNANMAKLELTALCFLLPGLAGLMISSMTSISYLENMPRLPDPPTIRVTPRLIHDVTVYQTAVEDRRLDIIDYSSTTVFAIGLGLSLVYLRKYGIAPATESEEVDLGYDQG